MRKKYYYTKANELIVTSEILALRNRKTYYTLDGHISSASTAFLIDMKIGVAHQTSKFRNWSGYALTRKYLINRLSLSICNWWFDLLLFNLQSQTKDKSGEKRMITASSNNALIKHH